MNIYEELMAGKTIDESKVNARFFVSKVKSSDENSLFTLMFNDPSYVIPLLKMLGAKDIENTNAKALQLYHSPGYNPFIVCIEKLCKDIKDTFKDNRICYDAPSLDKLQEKVDRYTIGAELMVDVSKLELFDLDDPDVVAKACG